MERTKHLRICYWLFSVLSAIAMFGPAAGFLTYGLITSPGTTEKITIMASVAIVLIMTVISMINKVALRSRIWIILLALYVCLDSFILPLAIIGGCQIVDEVILCPIKRSFRERLVINKEIDLRG